MSVQIQHCPAVGERRHQGARNRAQKMLKRTVCFLQYAHAARTGHSCAPSIGRWVSKIEARRFKCLVWLQPLGPSSAVEKGSSQSVDPCHHSGSSLKCHDVVGENAAARRSSSVNVAHHHQLDIVLDRLERSSLSSRRPSFSGAPSPNVVAATPPDGWTRRIILRTPAR